MTSPSDRSDLGAASPGRAPSSVRNVMLAVIGVLMFGAFYLIAARGEAMIVDLTAMAGKFWCF